MRHGTGVRRAAVAVGLAAVLMSTGLTPLAASGTTDTARPEAPTGIQIVQVSPNSFTVVAHRSAHAQYYRLYASTVRSDLFTANIERARHSGLTEVPRLTLSGLKYVAAPYFYRLVAINGSRMKFSPNIGEVGLQPARPSGLTVTANHVRSFLSWTAASATGYQVQRATNAAMTSHVRTETVYGNTPQYTPFGLRNGRTYYFRIRALNLFTPSPWSTAEPMTTHVDTFDVRVMTYNVLEATNDGRTEGGSVVAPWSTRKVAIAQTIEAAHPDVIGVQEAASFVGHNRKRQIDSLKNELSGYGLANTELRPGEPGWHRTGDYILFRKATFSRVGDGGHWALGNRRWAAWQVLRNRATGAQLLFVNAHLLVSPGGAADAARQRETERLIAKAHGKAIRRGIPVVYVGDFNSDEFRRHVYNAPAMVMRDNGIADAYQAAGERVRGDYNTANGYQRRPPRDGAHIDYVFAPPGVGVRRWTLEMRLSHGRFVGTIPSDHNALVADLSIPYS
jgi:endonuclease/exonuclease/phosphatase family metal-dependent hydrolase